MGNKELEGVAASPPGHRPFGVEPASAVSSIAGTPNAARLPVISMWQPFASLMFQWDRDRGDFAKCNETRGFKLPKRLIGQPVGIHATAKFPASRFISSELNDLCYDLWGCGYNFHLPFGALIGVVRFGAPVPTGESSPFQIDTELAAGDWSPGRWAWPVLSADALPAPILMKGRQGWWSVPSASVDTRPQGGDASSAAPFTSGAVPKADAR